MRAPARSGLARAVAAALVLAALALGAAPGGARLTVASARAGEPEWLAEFEAVCSRTQDAMSLSTEELRALVRRCDGLKPGLDALEPSKRKVYARRLQQCRELYRFVLESRAEARAG